MKLSHGYLKHCRIGRRYCSTSYSAILNKKFRVWMIHEMPKRWGGKGTNQ